VWELNLQTSYLFDCTDRLELTSGQCRQLGHLWQLSKKRLKTHFFRCVMWNVLTTERLCISYHGAVQVLSLNCTEAFSVLEMFQDNTLDKLTCLLLSHVKVESYSLEMVRRDVGVNVTEILSSSSGVRCDADRCDRWLVNRRTLDASSISIQVPQPTLFAIVSVTVNTLSTQWWWWRWW